VREREGVLGTEGGCVITIFGSRRKVTCRSPRRDVDAGEISLSRKTRRKERMAMIIIRLVAQNTKSVWSSRTGRVFDAGGPRSVCTLGFIIEE
jgi:hypothetical protein